MGGRGTVDKDGADPGAAAVTILTYAYHIWTYPTFSYSNP